MTIITMPTDSGQTVEATKIKRYLRPAEVAEAYNLSVSWLALDRRTHVRIPFSQVSERTVLYDRKVIEKYIADQTRT